MKAMILKKITDVRENKNPLELSELPVPEPAAGEVLVKLSACGVCHTELDEIEGRTPPPVLPVVPGHQAVGVVEKSGPGSSIHRIGARVGIAWIYSACGQCSYCRAGNENLCARFRATGRDVNGGYAQYMTVPERYAFPIPDQFSDLEAAPLLCAGAIGYRSLRLTGLDNGRSLGLTGFGASAHIVLKLASFQYPDSNVFVFARSQTEREFARELGAAWAGDIGEEPPQKIDCIIDTTPVWRPVVEALNCLSPGGRLVINAIRKEETDKEQLLRLDYPAHLWEEKEIKSVANVAASDVRDFLATAEAMAIKPEIQEYALQEANRALVDLKTSKIRGAKVLKID
jgi:propanol-preferring alcohol dehydrogenase